MSSIELPDMLDECNNNDSTDSWLFNGLLDCRYYGLMVLDSLQYYYDQVIHKIYKKPITDGFVIDHICCIKSCVNPTNLEMLTRSEINQRFHKRKSTIFYNVYNSTHIENPVIDSIGVA